MRVAWFDCEEWEKEYLKTKETDIAFEFFEQPLNSETSGKLEGFDAATVFVTSKVDQEVIENTDIDMIACRSTGYDHIDLEAAEEQDITVLNVPEYGATTVAEHTFGLILSLSRKIYEAIRKVREEDSFDHHGLRGFDLKGKTLGVIGTGGIGLHVIELANGFDMDIIAYDPYPDEDAKNRLGYEYTELEQLLENSDIVTIHCPLVESTKHLLSDEEFEIMEETVLINTARGEVIDTSALLEALRDGSVKAAGLDVLEEECFIEEDIEVAQLEDECDINKVMEGHELIDRDDVLVTPHNAFNSKEAMQRIVDTTLENLENKENKV